MWYLTATTRVMKTAAPHARWVNSGGISNSAQSVNTSPPMMQAIA